MANIPVKTLKNGFQLPAYGLGLWQMGGRETADHRYDAEVIQSIQAALEAGITHIDTAEVYGAGHAEELLGAAILGYPRHALQIATKVAPQHQSYAGVHAACEGSLKRMKIDYIDLYLLHHPNLGNAAELPEAMRAMDELVRTGLVKNIGVCNVNPQELAKIQSYTQNKLVCNQVHYNVQFREVEAQGMPQDCQQHDYLLVAWRPLEKGALLQNPLLQELAKKYNKTPAQIAINWLVSQKNVVTLAKTSNHAHLMENLGALNWQMAEEDIELLKLG